MIASFAGLLLVLAGCGLLISTLNEPVNGLVPLTKTPRLRGSGCVNAPEHTQVFVCLTTDGRVSFATSDPDLQRTVIEHIGYKYGVHFSANELIRLASRPFLALRLEALTTSLTGPTPTVSVSQAVSGSQALTEAQLLDCIAAAQLLSLALTNRPALVYLSIESRTTARLVMQLTRLLQEQGINRLYLLTHDYASAGW